MFHHPVSRRFVFSTVLSMTLCAAVSMYAQSPTDGITDLQLHSFQPRVSPELATQTALSSDLSVDASGMSRFAALQIAALHSEKNARTAAQKKIDSNVLYTERMLQGMNAAPGVASLNTGVLLDLNNNVVVDMVANVNDSLLGKLSAVGATVLYSNAFQHSIRASIAPNQIEGIAALPDVIFINPMQQARHSSYNIRPAQPAGSKWNLSLGLVARAARVRAMILEWQNTHNENAVGTTFSGQGSIDTEGDLTHMAVDARGIFGINGAGLKIGVLSDGVTSAALSQATGDLPPTCGTPPCLTVLSGQAGSGDEGTAMLEIIHDMVPGASLYFATADNSLTSFAANIQALKAAGCNIIVDDVFYFVESPFQDGQASTVVSTSQGGAVTQAVNSVVAAGVFYFSSAGNEGNLDAATSGTFEGDFVPMAASSPLPSGNVHNFGSSNGYDTISAVGEQVVSLFWTDPLGASGNDYDLYLLNSTGTSILAASTNIQNGTQDPVELIAGSSAIAPGNRIVAFQNPGAQDRFFHLVLYRGRLAVATSGETHGHSAASGAYTVAATPAAASFGPPTPNGPYPGAFTTANQTEYFSSDGLLHIFFNADSSAITPGNFLSTGGEILNKPDITAADGVSVTGVGGFSSPFYGTSAAAPTAASVAALVLAAKPTITAAQMKTALTTTAIDILNTGYDRDSGYGIVMPVLAIESLGVVGAANPEFGSIVATENPGNGNGVIERGEGALLTIPLQNTTGVAAATGITATLTSSTPGVTIMQPGTSSYADLAVGGGPENNLTPFAFTLASNFPCGGLAQFALSISFSGNQTRVLNFSVQTGMISITNTLGSTPTVPAGIAFVTGTQTTRITRTGVASACGSTKVFPGTIAGAHTFDSYNFQACSSQCFSSTLNAGASGVNLIESLYSPSYDPANIATGYAGDSGSSTNIQEFAASLSGNTQYSVVISDVNGNPPPPSPANTYTLLIPSCAINCNVNQLPVAIAHNVTVTAASYNGTASASIDNGSYDPDGGAVTLTQYPAGPYPIGTTPVILTVTDPLGSFAQATANVTVNQYVLSSPSLAEAFGAASIPLGGSTSLTFILTNPNLTSSLSGIGFTDSLPGGLVIATPNGLNSTCGAVTITAAAGSSSLSIGGVTISANSTCSISMNATGVAVGSQLNITSAIASLEGGAGSTASAVLTVVKGTPAIALTSSANPVPAQTAFTLTATLSSPAGAPIGSISFLDGTTSLGSAIINAGAANFSVPTLHSGSHSITAVYSGDTNFNTVTSSALTETVAKGTPAIALTSSANPVPAQTAFTLTATLSSPAGAPIGSISFLDGTTSLGSAIINAGAANFSVPTLHSGSHSITAVYSGDTNFNTVTSSALTETVAKGTPAIALTSSANPVPAQTAFTLTATLSSPAGAPTGSISFLDGTTSLGSAIINAGAANLAIPTLSAGSHSITAVYSGDTNFNMVTSSALTETVAKGTPNIILTSSANPVTAQTLFTLTATVSTPAGTPTGSISFLDGTTSLGNAIINAGEANLAVSTLGPGSHSITAVYSGDTNFNTVISSALTEMVVDFSFTFQSTTLTTPPDRTVVDTFTINPVNTTVFPAAVTFSVGGLPKGATYTLTPPSLAAGAGATLVTLSIQIPKTTASLKQEHNLNQLAPVALALVFLPFVAHSRKRARRLYRLSALLLWIAAVMALSGCGSSSGYFGQPQRSYNVTVTGTSGTVSRTSSITLMVQ